MSPVDSTDDISVVVAGIDDVGVTDLDVVIQTLMKV